MAEPASSASRNGPGSPALLRRSFQLWPLLLALAVFLCSLTAALFVALRSTDGRLIYAVDDTYIHMAIAKTLATHSIWGCTPYHFSSSSSSLLWTFVLGVGYRLFGVHDWMPLLLNLAFAIAMLVVAHAVLSRIGTPPLLRAATLVGIVVAFPLAGMVLLGMEHVLHLLLTIGFGAVAIETSTNPAPTPRLARRRTLALCLLGALLAASRYEGFFLVGLACLAFLARRQPLRAVAVGVATFLPVAAFGILSLTQGSYFLPNPLMVKAVGDNASLATSLLKPFGSEDLAFLQNNRAMPILLGLNLLAALGQALARRAFWRPAVLFPLALAGMIVLHGHFVFSPLYWVYRYDAYLVAFGLFATAGALAGLPERLAYGAWPALLVALLVPILCDASEGVFPRVEVAGMRNTYIEEVQTAEFLRRYYPRDAVIVNDLGAVTYYSEARILDLVGLGDIEPLRIMRRTAYTSREVVAWTTPYQPKVAIIQLNWSMVRPLIPSGWQRAAVLEIPPPNRHDVGFYAVDPKQVWPLRAAVAQHFGPLSRSLGYRLRLRRPEALAAAGDEPLETASRPERHGRPEAVR